MLRSFLKKSLIQGISCLKRNFWFSSKRNLEKHICSSISQENLELHSNSCEGPKIETLPEKLQSTNVEKFSCSKCDMDFDLEEALKEHSENCEIALLEPGEVHSKCVLPTTNFKENLFGTDENVKQIGHASEQVPNLESIEVKTAFKTEVTEEACEEFNANEQVGMDFITSGIIYGVQAIYSFLSFI